MGFSNISVQLDINFRLHTQTLIKVVSTFSCVGGYSVLDMFRPIVFTSLCRLKFTDGILTTAQTKASLQPSFPEVNRIMDKFSNVSIKSVFSFSFFSVKLVYFEVLAFMIVFYRLLLKQTYTQHIKVHLNLSEILSSSYQFPPLNFKSLKQFFW